MIRRKVVTTLAVSAALLAGAAVVPGAYAAPSSATVHACVSQSDRYVTNYFRQRVTVIPVGATRVVPAGQACKSFEKATSWAVKGATGAKGATGVKGATGAAGAKGATGAAGANGATGATGSDGLPGEIGPVGLMGPMGPTGETGPRGEQGANGLNGEPGPKGEDGATGPEGPAGAVGPVGPAGATGPGADGLFGTDTNEALDTPYGGMDCVPGEIRFTGGSVALGMVADGRLLNTQQYSRLFQEFGYRHGGEGELFALPDLSASTPNGLTAAVCVDGWGHP